ncbi:anti-sigma factor [Azospirillum sp.]|uniref:anti-sigma factor n=1 Tax=Azospirillum sp. TaxID=34012 RepID=UPI00260A9BF0|nr:anti-sigma factor [Azospirillum sp.]
MTSDPRFERDAQDPDLLAAEYALGTLRGDARAAFERDLVGDPALRASVARWQERLSGLLTEVEPVTPSAGLWTRILLTVDAADSLEPTRVRKPSRAARLWNAVALWRGLSLAAVAAACGLAVIVARPVNTPDPAVSSIGQPRDRSLIAVLQDGGRAAFAVRVAPGDRHPASVTPVGGESAPAGRSYELWAIAGAAPPVSLGVIGAGVTRVPLDRLPADLLRPGVVLAISLEPLGGSPSGAPTGPVLFTGAIVEAL